MKTGIDMDGTILNYGNHVTELRINHAFIRSLVDLGVKHVEIITNQGGLVWHASNPTKYPSPERFVERAHAAIAALAEAGITVTRVRVSVLHPKAEFTAVKTVRHELRRLTISSPALFIVYVEEASRKPRGGMLEEGYIECYFGDSDADEAAAKAAGADFVRVERFV
jgi:hypothetical protein